MAMLKDVREAVEEWCCDDGRMMRRGVVMRRGERGLMGPGGREYLVVGIV